MSILLSVLQVKTSPSTCNKDFIFLVATDFPFISAVILFLPQ